MPEPTRRITIEVSETVAQRLDEMAARKNMNVPELFRRAIATMAIMEQLADNGQLVVDLNKQDNSD